MTFRTFFLAGLSAVALSGVSGVAEARDKSSLGIMPVERYPYENSCRSIGRNPDCSGPRDFHPRKRRIHPNFYPQPYGLNWVEPDYYEPRMVYRLDCGEARAMVRERGFRKVVTRDCSGKTYSFTGSKNGRRYVVTVNARSGRIRAAAL